MNETKRNEFHPTTKPNRTNERTKRTKINAGKPPPRFVHSYNKSTKQNQAKATRINRKTSIVGGKGERIRTCVNSSRERVLR
ncbi:hypothetical protein DM02DRAFT_400561 [Periconia macrospinosa]|uniref:Uncharacterized protein n=1 Tax=Periconia macrospinosa TaxID=97972 RepID=A0A2V1DPN2_9PLEO|nr:hypothetical protein DM02DRAFT_400561 [Periconia macrospinosa]